MIFKVQRAIVSSEKNPPCLVYNEDRSVQFECFFTDLDEIFGDSFKVYVEGKIDFVNHDLELVIKEIVEDQSW